MVVGRRASVLARLSDAQRVLHPGSLGLALVAVTLVSASSAASPRLADATVGVRAVLSSSSSSDRSLTLSTALLYAKNDPWKAYLASERTCPGGERTDLPAAQQLATVACLVNFARKRRGLRRLAVLPVLNGAPVRKARQIIRCATFAHNPCGGDWTSAVRSTGYAGVFGENLYLASGPWGAPRIAVDAWLNSLPHRETLFGRAWREQGFAVVSRENFGVYRDVSLWVSVLGEG